MRKKICGLLLAGGLTLALASCGGGSGEQLPLTLSSQELDGVFNPFFATSAPDSEILSNTQISMLTNTPDGKPAYGDDEAVVVKDLQEVTEGTQDVDLTTTYYFVLKNNIKFSNGSPLTIKDVLFNLYVYLDSAYTGSSTIYSTDIVGLPEYKTQKENKEEQDSFMQEFYDAANNRRQALVDIAEETFVPGAPTLTLEQFKDVVSAKTKEDVYYKHALEDLNKAIELFGKELDEDFRGSMGTASQITFEDSTGKVYNGLLKSDTEAFLYNEGYINFNRSSAKLESPLGNMADISRWNKEKAIDSVIAYNLPKNISEIVQYWKTGQNLIEFIKNQELSAYNDSMTELKFPNISGIQFANRENGVDVNGKSYAKVEYNADGSVADGFNEVLSIKINNVDPKAIWNFGFPVAPMYYYSNQEQIDLFDFESHFGVVRGDAKFMEDVVKHPDKIGVPVGAGPYVASKTAGGTDNVTAGDFKDKNVVYFEANPYFVLGEPKIKKLRYKVIAQSSLIPSITNGEIDFVQPNADPETVGQVSKLANKGIKSRTIMTSGYGYIGLNAAKIPSRFVRMVIMHCINTELCTSFYGKEAQTVHRSLSLQSWAYPEGATSYYPFLEGPVPADLTVVSPYYADYVTELGKAAGDKLTDDEISEFIRRMLEEYPEQEDGMPNYKVTNGVYAQGKNTCKLTFTIAGSDSAHPAWQAFYKAKEILEKNHFEIKVSNDAQALKKLSNGSLSVWAAAWGSTIDPDLYQIYHKDSKATATLNWGYPTILNNEARYPFEYPLVDELSLKIEEARSVLDQKVRSAHYKEALDMIMELAVELPTYQRKDLFAYNTNKIDESTLNKDVTAFNGLLSRIWAVNLVK